nr:metallophosphoesterase [Bacillus sp. ISL-39]
MILVGILIWGLVEPYFLDIENEKAAIPNLPQEWEGKEVAVFGDFQVGMWMDNTKTVEDAAEKIAEMQPDVVLIIGDFIYHSLEDPDAEMQKVEKLINPLVKTDIPIFAVLGNHDYNMHNKKDDPKKESAQHVKASLEEMGITVLHNRSVPLNLTKENEVVIGKPQESSFYLAGLGARWPDNAKPAKAVSDIPYAAPRMIMMHNPETFAKLPANSAPIAVAGHTHGGQFRIPFAPEWSYKSLVAEDRATVDGWIDDFGAKGNHLYVNRGIGFSDLPLRINTPPEITVFTLTEA